jgi:hypothetical protein
VGCCAVALLKVSEDDEKVQVGSVALVAPVAALVTGQLSVTVPVNELPGVTVSVTVLEVPPWATVMLVGLAERLKPVVLLVLGACQKSPQLVSKQAKIGAAPSNNHPRFPIFIAAPSSAAIRLRHPFQARLQGIARQRILSCRRRLHTPAAQHCARRKPLEIRLSHVRWLVPLPVRLIDS